MTHRVLSVGVPLPSSGPRINAASLSAVILWKRVGIAQTLESLKTFFILMYLNLNDT